MSGGEVETRLREALARLERPLAHSGFLVGDVRVVDEGTWGRLDAVLEGTALSGKVQVHLNKKGEIRIVPQGNAAFSIARAIEGRGIAVTAATPAPVRAAKATAPALPGVASPPRSAAATTTSQQRPSNVRGVAGELVVDCSKYGKSLIGPTEWRGVLHLGADGWHEVFHSPVYSRGHNNLGEFLAIIDGCQRVESGECKCNSLWSDSKTALSWFRTGIIKTTLDMNTAFDPEFLTAIRAAQRWLAAADRPKWMKLFTRWDVSERGENPADFGRK